MSESVELAASFFCSDHRALVRSLIQEGLVPSAPPKEISLHGVKQTQVPSDWLERYEVRSTTYDADWPRVGDLRVVGPDLVAISRREHQLDLETLLGQLSRIEFEAVTFRPIRWWDNPEGPAYKTPNSSIGNTRLGFALAFRGAGHGRAMSRRWLERGPWRVLRGPNDTTLLQLHDLAADDVVSCEQAKPAHQIISDPLQAPLPLREAFPVDGSLQGTYLAAEREFVISVAGRKLSRKELRTAVATRYLQLLGADRPVDRVAFSFLDRAGLDDALPDLWLYGLEARLRVGDAWQRCDDSYQPPPYPKPAWVTALGRDDKVTS